MGTTMSVDALPPKVAERCDLSSAVARVAMTLSSLESADKIAEFFLREGVRGLRTEQLACPIAVFMFEQTGANIFVTPHCIGSWTAQGSFQLRTTKPLYEFIRAFDRGDYPQL